MNRNKVQSFRKDELENRIASTGQRMTRAGITNAFKEKLQGEIELIKDVIAKEEYVPSFNEDGTPHDPHAAALVTKLLSKEHLKKVAAKIAARAAK